MIPEVLYSYFCQPNTMRQNKPDIPKMPIKFSFQLVPKPCGSLFDDDVINLCYLHKGKCQWITWCKQTTSNLYYRSQIQDESRKKVAQNMFLFFISAYISTIAYISTTGGVKALRNMLKNPHSNRFTTVGGVANFRKS